MKGGGKIAEGGGTCGNVMSPPPSALCPSPSSYLLSALFAALIICTTLKLAVFSHVLSFGHPDVYKHEAGIVAGLIFTTLLYLSAWSVGRWAVLTVWLVQALYLLANWSYVTYFGQYLWWRTVLGAGGEGATAVLHGALPLRTEMLWILADLPVLIWWRWSVRGAAMPRPGWWLGTCATGLLAGLFAWQCQRASNALEWAYTEHDDRYTSATVFQLEFGLLPVQIIDARRPGPTPEDFSYGPEQTLGAPGRAARSLLIIQVESLDSGAIETAMPHLAARLPTALYAPRCLSWHGPGGSSDSDVAVLDGCEPLHYAVSVDVRGYGMPNSFIRRLRDAGWQAQAVHGLWGSYFNFAQVLPAAGYEFLDLPALGLQQHDGEFGARDHELVDALLPRIANLRPPFALHVITMSSHAPFKQYRTLRPVLPLAENERENDYRNILRYVDDQLERLITAFLARDPHGVVVLFGDHCAGLPTSPISRVDDDQREYVPLVILGVEARREERLVTFLDVGPTALSAVGWHGRYRTWGADLLHPAAPLPAVPRHGRTLPR